jgi:signal transduction histidine kinase
MTGLLLQMATTARDLVRSARNMNEQVQLNADLLQAARDYQGASYREVREPGPAPKAALDASRRRLERLLDDVARLPVQSEDDRRAAALITRHGHIVLEHFRNSRALVDAVDRKWHAAGMVPALKEASRVTAPAFALERVLRSTIGRGHGKVVAATDRAQALINVAVIAAIIGLLLAVGCSALVLLLVQFRLRPGLRSLQEGVQAFRAGLLHRRISPSGNDELADLSGAFNAMAATIEEKHAALLGVQDGLERTIAERTGELQHAYAQLSMRDERRRDFLANISHELKTALTVIRGEADVALRLSGRPGVDPHEALERIFEQAEDVNRIVGDLLLLALAEAGGLSLDRSPCDLQEILRRVAGDFDALAGDMGGAIRVEEGHGVPALVDPDKLRRALATLVENALHHCPRGVGIVLSVHERDAEAVIEVCDDGPGIDPALAAQLFQRFRRGDTASEGSGLGLNLAHALVEAHAGQMAIEARPGGGTRVWLALPLSQTEMEAA